MHKGIVFLLYVCLSGRLICVSAGKQAWCFLTRLYILKAVTWLNTCKGTCIDNKSVLIVIWPVSIYMLDEWLPLCVCVCVCECLCVCVFALFVYQFKCAHAVCHYACVCVYMRECTCVCVFVGIGWNCVIGFFVIMKNHSNQGILSLQFQNMELKW